MTDMEKIIEMENILETECFNVSLYDKQNKIYICRFNGINLYERFVELKEEYDITNYDIVYLIQGQGYKFKALRMLSGVLTYTNASEVSYNLTYEDGEEVNVHYVYLDTSLLDILSHNDRSFVLAHELGHIYKESIPNCYIEDYYEREIQADNYALDFGFTSSIDVQKTIINHKSLMGTLYSTGIYDERMSESEAEKVINSLIQDNDSRLMNMLQRSKEIIESVA